MKDNELIVCRDVSLGYEGRSVLTGLNLTISKGDYLCVVGDNGSGIRVTTEYLVNADEIQIKVARPPSRVKAASCRDSK